MVTRRSQRSANTPATEPSRIWGSSDAISIADEAIVEPVSAYTS